MGLFTKTLITDIEPSSKGPPVLLLHGFCEDHRIWNKLLPAFAAHDVYLIDLPGFGKSEMELPDPLSLDWVADIIYRQVIAVENIQPVVIGHSLGGYVALALAEKYESHLSGLCLFHSSTLADSAEKKATRNKVIDFVTTSGVQTFATQFAPALFHASYRRSHAEQVQKLVDLAASTPPETLIAYAEAMRDRPDRSHILSEFKKTKLVIAGEKDGAVPLEQSLLMKALVAEDQFVLLADTAHMGMYEKTEESKAALRSWL